MRVAIVGGGMAGLAAAWRLSRPGGPVADITVYERAWGLGGKGASSRGPHGRIEEHGLHVWLGYYDNAFRLMREVYESLDRATTDPGCPIRTMDDAFSPVSHIGLSDGGSPWVATFPTNDLVPGEGDGQGWELPELVERCASLAAEFVASLGPPVLSTRPRRPVSSGLRALATDPVASRRAAQFAELLLVMVRGIAADELVGRGYASIDHLDFREWLAGHGASPGVLDGPFVRGVYDLVFGYEDGDRARPRFAAGAGVHLAARMFLTYRGAMFWKMSAGMGDVVFVPLYQALLRRGVRFALGFDLTGVGVHAGAVGSLSFDATPCGDPLTRVGGLPVFGRSKTGPSKAVVVDDFDVVVLAVPVGVIPQVCAELVAADSRWRDMVTHLGTVATQSAQLWFSVDEAALGLPPGAVITGRGAPFDTMASLSHTVRYEAWDAPAPRSSISLCTVLAEGEDVAANVSGFLAAVDAAPVSVYSRSNTDPSDRYVQSLPGTGRYRLRADASGVPNLVLAGDWIDTGVNAGCIEAATLGGLQAANVVEGRPISDDTVGFIPHAQDSEGART